MLLGMSRAFVNEDAGQDQDPRYDLPERDSSFYDEAAAWASAGRREHRQHAECRNGYGISMGRTDCSCPSWKGFLEQAERDDNLRLAQLAKRYIRAAAKR